MQVMNVRSVNYSDVRNNQLSVNPTHKTQGLSFRQISADELKFLGKNLPSFPDIRKFADAKMAELGADLTKATPEASDKRDAILRLAIQKIKDALSVCVS